MRSARGGRSRRGIVAIVGMFMITSCAATVAGAPLPVNPIEASSVTESDSPTHQITEPTRPIGTTGEEPTTETASPLAAFYGQQLDWGSCADVADGQDDSASYYNPAVECSYLTVPLDYDVPDGATIAIGVLRSHATGDRIGSVVVNPGGPGAPGTSLAADIVAYGIAPELRERFDLVGFDPRGVGSSKPRIQCQTDTQRDQERAEGWPGYMASADAAEVDRANEVSKQFVSDCESALSAQGVDGAAFLGAIGTSEQAKDLDILRSALGDEQLTYIGWSYGTVLGTQYAEQFPGRTRAMVLDGAVDPALDSATSVLQQTGAFQLAFDDFASWCAGTDGCPWTEADTATADFQALAQPLVDHPLPLSDGRVLSFADATTGVISALYSDSSWPTLRRALRELGDGDGTILMSLADEYYRRDDSGHYSPMLEAFYAISCMDRQRAATDPDEIIDLAKKLNAAAPFQDTGQPPGAVQDLCAYWPAEPTMTAHVPRVTDFPTALVISTLGDPATPYIAGVNLADYLDARLLTVEGTRHGGYLLAGIDCVDAVGNDYLIDLRVPESGMRCAT